VSQKGGSSERIGQVKSCLTKQSKPAQPANERRTGPGKQDEERGSQPVQAGSELSAWLGLGFP